MGKTFFEFFAGGGMARAGLGDTWSCRFANDFDEKKVASYEANWGRGTIRLGDVRLISPSDLPGTADLVWGSFPCQDLSLAGAGAGLKGDRSGTFYPFWKLVAGLVAANRAPKIIALENVCGTLTSHNGADFSAIAGSFSKAGYRFGALIIDAQMFVPHSRPRLFIIGVKNDQSIPRELVGNPIAMWHSRRLIQAHDMLSASIRRNWVWWQLPQPPPRKQQLSDLLEAEPADVSWHSATQTRQLIEMMSQTNREKLRLVQELPGTNVGTIYKRTRLDEKRRKVQRAEVRFDDIAGCLRTPAGGSSRQLIMVVQGSDVRTRLISSRETARLMGLRDSYVLPSNYNEAYHLTGDGVAVPVVRYLTEHLFDRLVVPGHLKEGTRAA